MIKTLLTLLTLLSLNTLALDIHKETHDGGLWIMDGDVPLLHPDQAYEFTQSLEDKLIVSMSGNVYDVWSNEDAQNLTFCISDEFGDKKVDTINAFLIAANDWMKVANVNFVYMPEYDNDCNQYNDNVVFDVRPAFGQPYLARAFFPNYPRYSRSVLVNDSSFKYTVTALEGFIRHELGHVLGFRHEHIHAEGNGSCSEGGDYESKTPYDTVSVMHYPHCGGQNDIMDLTISDLDAKGAQTVYPFQ